MALRKSSKGFLMTFLTLILFLLMLAELITFITLNTSNDRITQNLAVSSTTSDYYQIISATSAPFARASLKRSLYVLADYEINASLRKRNMISNTSADILDLVINGTIPGVQYGTNAMSALSGGMGNLTINSYNSGVRSTFGSASTSAVSADSVDFSLYQDSPYTLSISYYELVSISSASGIYNYSIPVSATISLNGTPNLLAAQQGAKSYVYFASLYNLTNLIGGQAASGSTTGFKYGVVYNVPSGVSCSSLASSLPTQMQSPAFTGSIILVTPNAYYIANSLCPEINNYGGLITQQVEAAPSIPYLIYSTIPSSLSNGAHVMLDGPALETLNETNLLAKASDGYYFGSPFAPSYLDWGSGNTSQQDSAGIFDVHGTDTKVAVFRSSSSYITVNTPKLTNYTWGAWVEPITPTVGGAFVSNTNGGAVEIQEGGGYTWQFSNTYNPSYTATPGTMAFIIGVQNSTAQTLYYDGLKISSATAQSTLLDMYIGMRSDGITFNGLVGDVLLYNTSLNPGQVNLLYEKGLDGIPIQQQNLVGWWPLNGNANDYSGNGNNGVATLSVSYALPGNYEADSVIPNMSNAALAPIPGLLPYCTSNQDCISGGYTAFTGDSALEPIVFGQGTGLSQVGQFGGQGNNYMTMGSSVITSNQVTMSVWADRLGNGDTSPRGIIFGQAATYIDTCNNGHPMFSLVNSGSVQQLAYGLGPCPAVGQWVQYTGVYNGTSIIMYVNGTPGSPVSMTGNLQSGTVMAGGYYGSGYNFNGNIANIQLYNQALSPSEVEAIYQRGVTGAPLDLGIVGWWPLDGNANDYSGYNNNGNADIVSYPTFSGPYNAPGYPPGGVVSELQALGLPNK